MSSERYTDVQSIFEIFISLSDSTKNTDFYSSSKRYTDAQSIFEICIFFVRFRDVPGWSGPVPGFIFSGPGNSIRSGFCIFRSGPVRVQSMEPRGPAWAHGTRAHGTRGSWDLGLMGPLGL